MRHTKQREKFPGRKNERRRGALERIERQLAGGVKPAKRTHTFHNRVLPLTGADKKRLHDEADRLALLIIAPELARAIRTKKTPQSIWSEARRAWRRGKIAA